MSGRGLPEGHESIRRAVGSFGRFGKRWRVLEGVGTFLLAGPGLAMLWFAIDCIVPLPAWPLLLSLAAVCGVGLWAAVWFLARPLLRRVRLEREAVRIEQLHGQLDNQVIGSLQLGRDIARIDPAGRRPGYSLALVEALVRQTATRLGAIGLRKLLDVRRSRALLAAGAVVGAMVVGCLLLAGPAVRQRADRVRDAFAVVMDSLFPVEIRVGPGDLAVVRGKPVTLTVEVRGARQKRVGLLQTDSETGKVRSTELALRDDRAALTIPAVQRDFAYRFAYAGRHSRSFRILVGDLPAVTTISHELVYPAYTGQPARTLTGRIPKLRTLAGTSVLVSFASTTELHPEMSYVEWLDGTRQPLSVNGRFGHFSFTVVRPQRAEIHLTGKYGRGFEMPQPISLEIVPQPDAAPSVEILLRKDKMALLADEAARLEVPFLAEDDFGVPEVTLNYRIDAVDELLARPLRQNTVTRTLDPPRDRAKGTFAEAFAGLDPPPAPGDRIRIHLTARDNNTETGPGVGRSKLIEIIVVRPDLGRFTEKRFGLESIALLGGMRRIKRITDLLIEPPRTVRTEKARTLEKHALKSRTAPEIWPSGSEDAVGDYFRLLSGGK